VPWVVALRRPLGAVTGGVTGCTARTGGLSLSPEGRAYLVWTLTSPEVEERTVAMLAGIGDAVAVGILLEAVARNIRAARDRAGPQPGEGPRPAGGRIKQPRPWGTGDDRRSTSVQREPSSLKLRMTSRTRSALVQAPLITPPVRLEPSQRGPRPLPLHVWQNAIGRLSSLSRTFLLQDAVDSS
jgi:hypothetical protein